MHFPGTRMRPLPKVEGDSIDEHLPIRNVSITTEGSQLRAVLHAQCYKQQHYQSLAKLKFDLS